MVSDNILISVIVPVYNVEQYLKICIDSVLNQTYKNFELLLVDDGSTDSSGKICDEYTVKDSRITVFHKNNGGLSDARNYGMDKAQGEYYTFIDSDDCIGKDYLRILIDMIIKYDVQMAILTMAYFNENSAIPDESTGKDYLIDKEKAFEYMLLGRNFGISAWGKMYHRRLFSDIKYPKGYLYEDLFTTPYVLNKCDKVAYSDSIQYFYRFREDSITHRRLSKRDYVILIGQTKLLLFVEENNPEIIDAAIYRFINDIIGFLIQRLIYEEDYNIKIRKLLKKYNKILRKGITNKYLTRNRRIQLILVLISPRIYKKVYLYKSNKL